MAFGKTFTGNDVQINSSLNCDQDSIGDNYLLMNITASLVSTVFKEFEATCCSIQNQQHFIWTSRLSFFQDPFTFSKFFHQAIVCVQPERVNQIIRSLYPREKL